MVYVDGGQVCGSPPWSINRVVRMFDGILMFFILFFKTLIGMDTDGSKQNSSSSGGWGGFRGFGGGGGGGGSGRPNGPGGGGGSGPRFRSMRDINQPSVFGGGCPGGSCGM